MAARIGLTFDEQTNKKFLALAELDNKKPATLATEIVKNYMATREKDIERVLQMQSEYQKKIAALRANVIGVDGELDSAAS